jgi:hypothetical protein
MLDNPENLRDEYLISYEPATVYIDINYYTDVSEEENLIASSTWGIKIDDWKEDEQFQLVDELPNNYIDVYKPVICGGGRLAEPEKWYTFTSLVQEGSINIIYETLDEPHDPDSTMFPSKVIWMMDTSSLKASSGKRYWYQIDPVIGTLDPEGSYSVDNLTIPYLDLGYTPKEIGRLRAEIQAYSLTKACRTSLKSNWSFQSDCYDYFFGYMGAINYDTGTSILGTTPSASTAVITSSSGEMTSSMKSEYSPNSSGWFAVKGHCPIASGFIWTAKFPQTFDGHSAWNNSTSSFNDGFNYETVRELEGGWRNGYYCTLGNDYEEVNTYKDYTIGESDGFGTMKLATLTWTSAYTDKWERRGALSGGKDIDMTLCGNCLPTEEMKEWQAEEAQSFKYKSNNCYWDNRVAFNPITITIDAYNNYLETYDWRNSANPRYENVKNIDIDVFTRRCKPKGTLTLFATRNPDTGKMNLIPAANGVFQGISGYVQLPSGLESAASGNPYSPDYSATVNITQTVLDKVDDKWVEKEVTTTKQVGYGSYQTPSYTPQLRTCVWYLKIWDRDRLVRDLIPVNKGDKIYDYEAPFDGMFDKVTELFFGNANNGGTYKWETQEGSAQERVVEPEEISPFHVSADPTVYGPIVVNYYDENNKFINNQYVELPVHFLAANTSLEEILHYNDFKPSDYYHDGMIDVDFDISDPTDETLEEIWNKGSINIYYKLITYTKTVVYYRDNARVGSKDIFYSIEDIDKAETLSDLGIDVNLYQTNEFAKGRVVFNEKVIADDDIQKFIDAASPIVVYDKLTKEEAPNLLYLEWYRGGAYEEDLITLDEEDPNYLHCDLEAVALNPNGVIKYLNHYHSALYEDEKQDYFIAYQVDVKANYVAVHKGPARRYSLLATIVDKGRYTVIEERNGWGRLKEYPKGWIMLSYTEPTTGPGQNPAYDAENKTMVSIPFGTKFSISRMTIDRLWCYSPEYGSWVKAEEISFDQSGKLYNALGIKVINLDTIDWNNASTIFDMGISPDQYLLKYHESSNYSYDGEFTKDAFSEIHELNFVYPETIYAYNCIYYKDAKLPSLELGRTSFSCSMSDWNPDWDTFIETSYRYDDDNNPINPTLYRSTPLTLTWDYFGFDRNLYKPEIGNYDDGLYLWNPRTYENEDVYFTFEEIVTTTGQEVLYVPTLQKFKLVTEDGGRQPAFDSIEGFTVAPGLADTAYGIYDIEWKGGYNLNSGSSYIPHQKNVQYNRPKYTKDEVAPYLPVLIRGGGFNFYPAETGSKDRLCNLAFPYRWITTEITNWSLYDWEYVITNMSNKRNNTTVYSYGKSITKYQSPYYTASVSGGEGKSTPVWNEDSEVTRTLDWTQSQFNAWGESIYLGEKSIEYHKYLDENSYEPYGTYPKKIEWSFTDWDGTSATANPYHYVQSSSGSTIFRQEQTNNFYETDTFTNVKFENLRAAGTAAHPFYYYKLWKNYRLQHYYVPVARGAWLPDGRQVEAATMYDLITGVLADYVTSGDGVAAQNKVYPINAEVTEENVYSPFDVWSFDYEDCSYNVKTTALVIGYKYPDVLATQKVTYPKDTVIPVRKVTSDAANNVLGEWYFNGDVWFKTDNTTILATDEYKVEEINPTRKLAIKGDTSNAAVTYKSYLSPDAEQTTGSLTFTSEEIAPFRYQSGDFYWSVNIGWMPISYTQDNVNPVDEKWVVQADYLSVYEYPVRNESYRVKKLLSGDRVNVTQELVKDTDWKKISDGWIYGYNAIGKLES